MTFIKDQDEMYFRKLLSIATTMCLILKHSGVSDVQVEEIGNFPEFEMMTIQEIEKFLDEMYEEI